MHTFCHEKHNRILLIFLLYVTLGCKQQPALEVTTSPKHFKVETPFMYNRRGLIINTYWGRNKQHLVLCLDNHSPSWIRQSLVRNQPSLIKTNGVRFKTSTADGSPIQGNVGICDSLSFANILFTNIPFYVMPDNPEDKMGDDGVFGIDAMEKGVWKIDFKTSMLSLASSIDSFPEIGGAEIFPASFDQHSVNVEVDLGNNTVRTLAIDLGYNGEMLLPQAQFNRISPSKKKYTSAGTFDTPAGEHAVNNLWFFDTVKLGNNWFGTRVSSNESAKEYLVGLPFFKRFDYVIFDFIDRRIYIPKKVW